MFNIKYLKIMKKYLIILCVILIVACSNTGKQVDNTKQSIKEQPTQSTPVISLKECYDRLNQHPDLEECLFLAEQFNANRDCSNTLQWIPVYYASYCVIEASFIEHKVEIRDELIDKAQKLLDECFKIDSTESELYTLQGYLYQARLNVSPVFRGSSMSKKAVIEFKKATELNSDNPRPAYLEALGLFYAPAMFGGGKDKAYPLFKEAKEKYDSFSSEILYFPSWGEETNLSKLKICEESLNL